MLLPVLEGESYSADDKYQAAVQLSYTYKRVFDYVSALKFLDLACTFANQTTKKTQYIAAIDSEKAFILFDTHDYKGAGVLMRKLEKTGFKYITQENRSKLIMQRGYLLFLGKQYERAEAVYDQAIHLLRAVSPCDLPMVFVKKMQLYDAMNRLDLMNDALHQSVAQADSCHIIKYNLYVYNELLAIYKKRRNLDAIVRTQSKVDSLTGVYASSEKVAALHDQKEAILLENKSQELHQKETSERYLTLTMIGLLVLAGGLLIWLLQYHRKQQRLKAEFAGMKHELESYLVMNESLIASKMTTENDRLNKLSERQREVLSHMAAGMSNKAIADTMFISENTVKYHIKNIYILLEIKDRREFLVSVKK
ncbi:LuxR family transcriptional regulator [Spirosoma sp. KUDC1026]|nr:LuxR family transcriptional regulator [Spirosoma sp. KUDC1026]